MNSTLTFLLFGLLNALFLVIFLIHKYRHVRPIMYIVILLICYVLTLLHILFYDLAIYKNQSFLQFIFDGNYFLFFPLLFIFSSFLQGKQAKKRHLFLHAIPFILYKFFLIGSFFYPVLVQGKSFQPSFKVHEIILNWILSLQAAIYLSYSIQYIRNYLENSVDNFSTLNFNRRVWLKLLLYSLLTILTVFISENILVLLAVQYEQAFLLTNILSTFGILIFAYFSLYFSDIFADAKKIIQVKYKKSGLTEKEIQDLLVKLQNLMEKELLYLDSELTLEKLANYLKISVHNLSEVINTGLKQNFFEYINSYRVHLVKEELRKEKSETILSIAFRAGFNSKTSFNTVFKKMTGLTPSQYRKQLP